jgi:hypothetical protein
MKLNRKIVALISVIMVTSFFFGTAVFAAAPEGNVLDELWGAIFGIQDEVDYLQDQVDLQAQITELQLAIVELQAQKGFLSDPWIDGRPGPQGETGPQGPSGGFGAPDYDSGWTPIGRDSSTVFDDYSLETDDCLVYIYGRYTDVTPWLYHQLSFGGDSLFWGGNPSLYQQSGVWWDSEDLSEGIEVYREQKDVRWTEVRVLIWAIN